MPAERHGSFCYLIPIFIRKNFACGLTTTLVVLTPSVVVADQNSAVSKHKRESSIVQPKQTSTGDLTVTVNEAPRSFDRVGQKIKLVYVITNVSDKNISNNVYVADSDAQVICAPLKRQALPPGGTLQCNSTLHIDQQHFAEGEMRHNFSVIAGGSVSNIQESVICRKGWESECDANTKIICEFHRKLTSTLVRPDICNAMIFNTSVPSGHFSPYQHATGGVYAKDDFQTR
jgi:hypothetical protein